MADRVSITVFDNGPYKVAEGATLSYCGEAVDSEGDVFLCRCGQSASAPFCDGTHRKVGFDDAVTDASDRPIKVWEGETVRTYFNPNVCMHARYCRPLKALRERELGGDAAAAQEIMAVVLSCPSGALTYETKSELTEPDSDPTVDVVVMEGGEIRVQRAFDINVDRPERQPEGRATLCRCGLSKNKPWCDGRHASRTDFR